MKLESLLHSLDKLRATAETNEYERDMIILMLIQDLLEYIDNQKVSEAVDEIVF